MRQSVRANWNGPERCAVISGGALASKVEGELQVAVTSNGTGLPLTSVGVNSHCLTASTAAPLSSGIPWVTWALLTCPSASTRA